MGLQVVDGQNHGVGRTFEPACRLVKLLELNGIGAPYPLIVVVRAESRVVRRQFGDVENVLTLSRTGHCIDIWNYALSQLGVAQIYEVRNERVLDVELVVNEAGGEFLTL